MDLNPKGCWFESNWRSSEPCQGLQPRSKTRKRRENESGSRARRGLGAALRRAAAVLALTAAVVASTAATTAMDSHPADASTAPFDAPTADRAALIALAKMQDPATGLWPIAGVTAWWSSANDVTAVVDAERALGTHQYDSLIARTYAIEQDWPGPEFHNSGPDFKNNYYDDTAWWGLAWLDAYRWTGDPRYLATAEDDDAYIQGSGALSSGPCGTGGIRWAVPIIEHGDQYNAITNELAIELSAQLATLTGRASYRTEALWDWGWLQRSGLIGRDGLVRDHLDASCRPTGPPWSYNQGVLSAALVALAQATSSPTYLTTAHRLADAATSARLNPGGILTDPCEPAGVCGIDGGVFKGASVRGLGVLNRALPDHPYSSYLERQAEMMYQHDRLAGDLYGPHWAGQAPWSNPATQGPAVDLLTATIGSSR